MPADAERQPDQPRARGLGNLSGPVSISVVLLLVGVYYALTWKSLSGFVAAIDHCDLLFCDFVRHYYPMGQEIFSAKSPVDGYLYSIFFALLMAPLAQVGLSAAVIIWGLMLVGAMYLLYALPGRTLLAQLPQFCPVIYLLVFVTSVPILHNFKWGQVSVFIVLCVVGALEAYLAGRRTLAAILLALAISTNYYAAIFVLIFLVSKEYRLLGMMLLAVAIFLLALPVLLIGFDETIRFQRLTGWAVQSGDWIVRDVNSQHLAHVVARCAGASGEARIISIFKIVGWLLAGVNVLLVWFVRRSRPAAAPHFSMALLFLSLPLLLKTSWAHYYVFLPFCQLVMTKLVSSSGARRSSAVALYVLIVASILMSNVVVMSLFSDWREYSRWGLLYTSSALLLLVAYLWLADNLRGRAEGSAHPRKV